MRKLLLAPFLRRSRAPHRSTGLLSSFSGSLPLLVVLTFAACSSQSEVVRLSENRNLSTQEAEALVKSFKARRQLSQDAAENVEGAQLAEAWEILKSDQIDRFARGVAIARQDTTVEGKALEAQILLAWGEAQEMLADLLSRSTFQLRDERVALQRKATKKALDAKEQERLKVLDETLADVGGLSDALMKLSDDHLAQGLKAAQNVMLSAPNDYQGYRVAADYYRLVEDWPKFDAAMTKLTELKPDSNGLVFARAMEALERKNDRTQALQLLDDALAKDPKFTRARAQKLMTHRTIDGAWKEFELLKKDNPDHQIVRWLGTALEREKESYDALAQRGIDVQSRFGALLRE